MGIAYDVKSKFRIGDIIMVPALYGIHAELKHRARTYMEIDGQTYYANKRAIIIGYTDKCSFTISNLKLHECAAIALGKDGGIFLVKDNQVWRVVDHVSLDAALKSYLSSDV